jgi:hypothetical protein
MAENAIKRSCTLLNKRGCLPAPAAAPIAVLVVALIWILGLIRILWRTIDWWLNGAVACRWILVTVGFSMRKSEASSQPAPEAPVSCAGRVGVDVNLVASVISISHANYGKS